MNRLLLTLCALLAGVVPVTAQGHEFYVSPSGNDTWSGKLPAPSTNKTDGPFRTFAGARDALRRIKTLGLFPGGATVNVRGGTYTPGDTFLLTAEDSGTVSGPMIWRA